LGVEHAFVVVKKQLRLSGGMVDTPDAHRTRKRCARYSLKRF
jgi:hypothetical protein